MHQQAWIMRKHHDQLQVRQGDQPWYPIQDRSFVAHGGSRMPCAPACKLGTVTKNWTCDKSPSEQGLPPHTHTQTHTHTTLLHLVPTWKVRHLSPPKLQGLGAASCVMTFIGSSWQHLPAIHQRINWSRDTITCHLALELLSFFSVHATCSWRGWELME